MQTDREIEKMRGSERDRIGRECHPENSQPPPQRTKVDSMKVETLVKVENCNGLCLARPTFELSA